MTTAEEPSSNDAGALSGVASPGELRAPVLHPDDLASALDAAGVWGWRFEVKERRVVLDERFWGTIDAERDGFGMSEREWLALIHPDDVGQFRSSLASLLDGDSQAIDAEHRLRANTGVWGWFRVHGRVTRCDERGQPLQLAGVYQDVSHRRRAEAEREQLQTQLHAAEKKESLGMLAGGIAHDFNNLLSGILGSVELALLDLPPNHGVRRDLECALATAERAAVLCSQLLAYSGKGRFLVEPVDLSGLIREMEPTVRATVGPHIDVGFALQDPLAATDCDGAQLRQAILSLLANAAEAIGRNGGEITISTGQHHCDRAYLSRSYCDDDLPEGPYVFVEVVDNGCGMDEQVRRRVFDPFFSTKSTGRGLGLSAVLGIARAHFGTVKVFSELGRGSAFKVLLPASATATATHEPTEAPEEWRGHGEVLLIDDDEAVRKVGKRLLERLGFDVVAADSGRRGVELFAERSDSVRVILLDMTMPDMEGKQVLRLLRGVHPTVPVVLTSGYDERQVTGAFGAGELSGFIQKPLDLRNLRDGMRSALLERK